MANRRLLDELYKTKLSDEREVRRIKLIDTYLEGDPSIYVDRTRMTMLEEKIKFADLLIGIVLEG